MRSPSFARSWSSWSSTVGASARPRSGAACSPVQAGSNGGDLTPGDFAEVEQELEDEASALAVCIERIQSAGAQVKDLDEGLLDFPAVREGEEILLCWRLGEDEIGFWHGPDEGFAGRKAL